MSTTASKTSFSGVSSSTSFSSEHSFTPFMASATRRSTSFTTPSYALCWTSRRRGISSTHTKALVFTSATLRITRSRRAHDSA